MPATEKTLYNQKLLHKIFGISSVVLLLATIWMFAVDHNREWKEYQREARDINVSMSNWLAIQEEATGNAEERERLSKALKAAKASPPDQKAVDQFIAEVVRYEKQTEKTTDIAANLKALDAAIDGKADAAAIEARSKLIEELRVVVTAVKFRENSELTAKKFKAADFDVAKSDVDIAVRDDLPKAEYEARQDNAKIVKAKLDEIVANYQAEAKHRKSLEAALKEIERPVTDAQDAIDETTAKHEQLLSALTEQEANWFTTKHFPGLGKKWLELPILDAFGSPLRIDNLWTDGLEHRHYNFSDVTRFDRCTTCHKMLEKKDAVFQKPSEIKLTLQKPSSKADTLEATFGIKLASKGLAQPDDVTIQFVTPKSIAAQAITKVASSGEISAEEIRVAVAHGKTPGQVPASNGLAVGDVITHIAGVEGKLTPALVRKHLMNSANWNKPIELTIRRGFANPYQAHPRLDLYLDSSSPHKLQTFGCTVCHEGQGSATTFKWASHTPNDEATRKEWTEEHGWFDNHHWIMPMMPERFIQSSCLKCHHEVAELEKSPRFPEPPAEKLTDGYHLIRRYGCFGCHEINGYDGPDQRIGPDLRLEPNYFAAALQLKIDPNLSEDQRDTATRLANDPDDNEARQALFDLLKADEGLEKPTLTPQSHNLAAVLKKVEVPGRMRKVGPSLRHVAQKASESFLYDWIAEPKNFRPETRMPQFFGLHKHLQDSAGLKVAEDNEPVEILGIVKYLQNVSQPFEVSQKEISGDATRGKTVFEVGGCSACHQHDDLPGIGGDQGPNLSRIGGKTSKKWLYAWIENPKAYHARSKMPKVFLDPLPGHPDSDPIADVVEFLAAGGSAWTPKNSKLTVDDGTLKDVVLELLEGAFFKADAEDYLANGIPTSMRSSLKGAEVELVSDSGLTTEQKLLYVGRKAIGKYGCSACHDIPGFENSKPIGAALAEWGTKDPSKLAFEHMHEYLHAGHDDHADSKHGEEGHNDEAEGEKHDDHATDAEHGDDGSVPPFFERQLNSHSRIGFLYQKLREPRSYDYQKTENKGYNERLRMPQFPFNDAEREKVMTFVLGLTASPPRSKFVFQPDQRAKTIIEGRRVLKKYNCGGCHTLELEKWDIAFKPGTFRAQSPSTSFPYLRSDVSAEALAQSKEQDSAGLLHATIAGMLRVHTEDGLPLAYDEEEDEIEPDEDYDPSTLIYLFDLWQPTAIEGTVFRQGVKTFEIPATAIEKKHPAWGGDLPRWAIGTAIQIEKDVTKERTGKGGMALSWLPPPLIGEGKKVQTDWLHDFLLDPHQIRPASITRMPKFNMSSDEAEKLVNYFAAVENMDYPYEFKSRTRTSHIAQAEATYTGKADGPGNVRMGDAMNIVVSLCVQCHHVGDFHPDGNPRGHGPDLSEIYRRMRPGYLRDWIADPKLLLPYTAMPSNIPYKSDDKEHLGGVSQDLYHGTSIDQVEGLVDLLMNFDDYSRKRSRVVPLFLANEVAKKVVERQTAEAAVVAANEVLDAATKALDAAEEPADKEAAQAKVTAAEGALKTAEDALKAADDALKIAEDALKKA